MLADIGVRPSITAFFPCYNEVANVEHVIRDALRYLPALADDFEVLIIDDGSIDKTAERAGAIAQGEGRVRVISHRENLGYGRALRTGFESAKYDLIFYADGDGQFSLKDLALLVGELEDHGFILGYRRNRADPLYRRLNGWLWTTLVRALLGIRVRDVDCGFKLFRREAVRLEALFSGRGAAISAELITRAIRAGYKYKEVGVTHYPRKSGQQSGNSPGVIGQSVLDIIRLWRVFR